MKKMVKKKGINLSLFFLPISMTFGIIGAIMIIAIIGTKPIDITNTSIIIQMILSALAFGISIGFFKKSLNH
ncbi:MAG: hypothetical protein KJ592_00675 [Nanoarchaeota archaeon]|nr:hypothetical protein [Nanoarchaeota archaeon]